MVTGLVDGLGHLGNPSEQVRKDSKEQGRRRKTGAMSSFPLLCLLRHGAPSPLLCHPSSSSADHKEAARTLQVHDVVMENSRFHFDVCLKGKKS